ncbi:MAG: hypothetical protein PSX36_07220 [bacterium]|nr:hypothetical protein [bacterium]
MAAISKLYKQLADRVDIPFLLFLITISSNKVVLKVAALVLIFALRPKFEIAILKKLPLFYPLIIGLATLQFLLVGGDFSSIHFLVFGVGCLYWTICYAYMYQARVFVEENTHEKIDRTLLVYILLNAVACLYNYFDICVKAETLFPFLQFPGNYGASTGDYICGLFGVPSYMNAIVNSLFALYFLHRKKMWLFLITTFVMLLSFANIINLVFVFVLLVYALFAGDNRKRAFIGLNLLLCFAMYFYVSPDNYNYIKKTIGLSVHEEREIMPEVVMVKPGAVDTVEGPLAVKYVNDSSAAKQKIRMIDRNLLFHRDYSTYNTYAPVDITKSPGKKIAILQTINFLRNNKDALFVGAGIGNFSSRLAYQFSGRDSSRLFMKLPKYAHGYYFQNNLLIYDSMRQLPTEYHSIKHFPNNFFSQLLGEYGLLGAILFFVFYVAYFYKRAPHKTFFFMLALCVASYLMLDYLFEFFNVMMIFELFLFIDAKADEKSMVS